MRRLFILILTLTAADALCTAAGLRLGVIAEANPLLSGRMAASPALACAGLCVFVTGLLSLLYILRDQVKWMKIALAAVAEVKLVVLGMHFAWLVRAIKCVSFM